MESAGYVEWKRGLVSCGREWGALVISGSRRVWRAYSGNLEMQHHYLRVTSAFVLCTAAKYQLSQKKSFWRLSSESVVGYGGVIGVPCWIIYSIIACMFKKSGVPSPVT